MTPTATLSEERRKQLDDIVSQMEANNESEDNIQFVVNDFKTKYSGESGAKKKYTNAIRAARRKAGSLLTSFGECCIRGGEAISGTTKVR